MVLWPPPWGDHGERKVLIPSEFELLTWAADARRRRPMFIAMNRFQVKAGQETAFEAVWLGRDTHLSRVPGFLSFNLLRGPETESGRLYASHSTWTSRDA